MQRDDAFAALIQACHRALDDLARLDSAKPIVCVRVDAEHDDTARSQELLYRWRSTEAGGGEERCFIVRIA